jgi:hypothetical protein
MPAAASSGKLYRHAADLTAGACITDDKHNTYILGEIIGRGGFGTVYASKVTFWKLLLVKHIIH